MKQTPPPFPDPAELERLAWLARLVSPLIHRINNQLAVLRGACDIGLPGTESPLLSDATQAIGTVAVSLSQLSTCSKALVPICEPFDPGAAVRSAQLLLDPLTSHHEVNLRYAWLPDATPAVVGDHERLVQILVWFAAAGLLSHRPEGDSAPRLRLALHPKGERVALTLLCAHGSPPDPNPLTGCLAAARALAERTDADVVTAERFGTVTVLRLVFKTVTPFAVEDSPPAPDRTARRRILLLDADEARRELVRTILEEEGYLVRAPDPTAGPIDDCDLLLMDADLVGSRRDLLEAPGGPPVAFLGFVVGTDRPQLPTPFRPGELFEFVAAQLA